MKKVDNCFRGPGYWTGSNKPQSEYRIETDPDGIPVRTPQDIDANYRDPDIDRLKEAVEKKRDELMNRTAEPVKCCYCGEECNPSYHTDWGIVCGKHCLTNPFRIAESDQPQPSEPRLTELETLLKHAGATMDEYNKAFNSQALEVPIWVATYAMKQFAQQEAAVAVAAKEKEIAELKNQIIYLEDKQAELYSQLLSNSET